MPELAPFFQRPAGDAARLALVSVLARESPGDRNHQGTLARQEGLPGGPGRVSSNRKILCSDRNTNRRSHRLFVSGARAWQGNEFPRKEI
jgi:hypothetical protein